MSSLKRKEGYLMVDHRASPGLPADFYEKCYGIPSTGLARQSLYESAVATCAHCNTSVILNPLRTRARGYCPKCDDYICDNPACAAQSAVEHKSFSQLLDEAEKRAYHEQQTLMTTGFIPRKD